LTGGIERLWADARSGLRLLARRPGFAATAGAASMDPIQALRS